MIFHTFLIAALASVAGIAAEAAPAAQGIERAPTAVETAFAYPRPAYRAHLAGTASLDCAVDPSGGPKGCDVVSETPSGHDFGKAAKKLVAYMRFHPASAQYRTRFDINFEPTQSDKWPDYLHLPAAEEIQHLWPQGTRGEYWVGCRIGADATLHDCEIVKPVGVSNDLQKAAVETMRLFQFSPASFHGEPAPSFVVVPLRF